MRKASQQTSSLRFLGGAVFSLVAPSMMLAQGIIHIGEGALSAKEDPLLFTLASPIVGAFFGWPFVIAGLLGWVVLDRLDRHYVWAAAGVGAAVGASVAFVAFRDGRFFGAPAAYPLCIGIGLLTGLGVWWIAYGRQSALPSAQPRRPPRPLSL